MKLEGIHHITAITADAQANVDFYAGTLGLRMVKKTVNQDAPSVYHLFYADEQGSPGSDITFFEFRGAPARPRRRRDGPPDRLAGRLGRGARLLGRAARRRRGRDRARRRDSCASPTPRASSTSSSSPTVPDQPLIADHPEVPGELALQGFHAARAYSADPERSARPAREPRVRAQPATAGRRAATRAAASGPTTSRRPSPGCEGAGTVHHIAWASEMDEHLAWRERAIAGGARPTPVIDRFWFRSIYFREPSGVLFEIATLGPGLRGRRGSRAPRRGADPAAVPRGPARADRGGADPGRQPAAARASARLDERRARPPAARAGGRARGRADPQPRPRRRRERPLRPARRARPRAPAARRHHRRAADRHPAGRAPLVPGAAGRLSRTRRRSPAATRRSPASSTGCSPSAGSAGSGR